MTRFWLTRSLRNTILLPICLDELRENERLLTSFSQSALFTAVFPTRIMFCACNAAIEALVFAINFCILALAVSSISFCSCLLLLCASSCFKLLPYCCSWLSTVVISFFTVATFFCVTQEKKVTVIVRKSNK